MDNTFHSPFFLALKGQIHFKSFIKQNNGRDPCVTIQQWSVHYQNPQSPHDSLLFLALIQSLDMSSCCHHIFLSVNLYSSQIYFSIAPVDLRIVKFDLEGRELGFR